MLLGYVKMYREILDNPIVCKDSDYFAIWSYLLLKATHKEMDGIFKGERIKLKSGQLITGRKSIAEKFNIDESKVQRVLKTLENAQQIEQQTSNKNRLISIVNWHLYQVSEQQVEQQVNNNCTTSEQQVNTNKNDKKEKNENNNNISKDIYVNYIDEWNSLGIGDIKIIKGNREKLLKARIKEFGEAEIIKAIQSINNSNFLKGQNNKGWIITFDWLIKPNNFTKVLEGNYLNKEHKKTSNAFDEF